MADFVKKVTAKSYKIYEYVKAHEDEDITAADIAEGLGLGKDGIKSVNAAVTASFQNNKDADKNPLPLMKRVEAEEEVEKEDGSVVHKTIKLIKLTDAGRTCTVEVKE